ncbi:MAG: AAA family ATPase [Thermoleophilia bacterium]
MRPLQLDLTAFRSYDRATVDLRPFELVVITGDTGAGKTSLLDAIAFALFGTTPERVPQRDLLTLGAGNGEVRLTFQARGEAWRVTRRYGPDAPDPVQLLERLDGDGGDPVETLAGEEACAARLSELIGMSFQAFTSAVLLAQGRFAEFLGAQPRARDGILRELFGVASMEGARTAALAHAAQADGEAGAHEAELRRLPAHGPATRAEAARRARQAAARAAAARALLPLAARQAAHAEEAARARARADDAEAAAAELPDEDAGAALLARLEAAHRADDDARAAHARAAAAHEDAVRERDALRARHGGGAAELAALGERAGRAAALAAELPARRAALAERERALAERRAALARLAEEVERAGLERDRVVAVATALDAWRAHDAAAAAAAAEREAAVAAEAAAARALEGAAAALAEARRTHDDLRVRDMAATLRAGLSAGDACPVCGAPVGDHDVATGDLHAAEVALAAARDDHARAGGAAAAAAERARAAAEAWERAARERDEARARLAALDGRGTAVEEALDDDERLRAAAAAPAERAEAARAAFAAAQEGAREEEAAVGREAALVEAEAAQLARGDAELADARAGLGAWAAEADPAAALGAALAAAHAADAAAEGAAAGAGAAAEAAARARDALAEIERDEIRSLGGTAARVATRGRLPLPADDLTPRELVAAAIALRSAARDAAAVHRARARDRETAARRAAEDLAAAGAPLGATEASQVDGAARRAAGARDAARAELAAAEGAAAEARRLTAAAAAARGRAELHRQVANDLRANRFPRFLLNRYQERLAAGASTRLQELSAGAYRFAGTGTDALAVVDTRRGERPRPAATLSGGERFLASLALALGLSDIAAESGGRLDCLFLDEGFSTLDADSLEQAMAGIERLAGDGRLVAVITHLPGVAERLGASLHVTKDPASGVSSLAEAQAR